ncbi:MAG: hypothetical protein HOV94_36955 [Saccharothrix sp.]|nr:hypothetical protein [Saccharothrix sp.]
MASAILVTTGPAAPGGAVPAPRVSAEEPLSITYVARACPEYTDIMANKARNNLQESLRDLGPDSTYAGSDEVTASDEASGTPLPPCEPLPGWTFSTGTGFTGRTGTTLNLSTVTGLIRQDITTTPSTPELNSQGHETGRTIEGAVTVELTGPEQDALLKNRLWVQGGTPGAPLNGLQEQYGFGALRCALDAVNGDNVESVAYPSQARHVFCYYYSVTPPPGAGTITVVKHLDGSGQGDFRFDGNISYADSNGDGANDFVLSAATDQDASQTFIRGESTLADDPWVFTEVLPDGSAWGLAHPAECVAVTAGGGPGSSAVVSEPGGEVRVGLVAGETVTCTYTDQRTGGLGLLEKETLGGTGTFDIDLIPPPGAPPIETRPVTTTEPGVPVTVVGPAVAVTGVYTAVERKPEPDGRGTWELTGAVCNDEQVPIEDAGDSWRASHEVVAGENPECLLTNEFTPGGSIDVEKVTRGGTGTFGYVVLPRRTGTRQPLGDRASRGTATTAAEDTPTHATRADGAPGPLATELLVDDSMRYDVVEFLPPATAAGQWQAVSVDCGGAEVGTPRPNVVEVVLTPANPTPTCRFTNVFVPAGTLSVVKTTTDDDTLRPDPARLLVTCADDTLAELTVPPGVPDATTTRTGVNQATECTVSESATGAAATAEITTTATITVNDGEPVPVALDTPFPVRPGENVVVRVDNAFTTPTTAPVPPETAHLLAGTGLDLRWWLAATALAGAMLATGVVLVRTARSRRRVR